MRRAATEHEAFEVGGQSRRQTRLKSVRKERLRRLALDTLETRTLLSTLPPVTFFNQPLKPNTPPTPLLPVNLVTAGPQDNNSSPQVAIDRYDPQKMVAVWVNNDPAERPGIPIIVEAAYSTDGGAHWSLDSSIVPNILTDPASSPQNPIPFANTTDPKVGFDAQNNFYIMVVEHSAAYTSGAVVITKASFSGTSPNPININNQKLGVPGAGNANVVAAWTGGAGYWERNPDMAVDDNLPSFTDPTTKLTQVDPSSGHVYIAWEGNDPAPPSPLTPANYNPYSINLVTSADGGVTWTTPRILNEFGQGYQHVGSDANAVPRIAISQGSPTVPGGQVNVVWDDWGVYPSKSPNQDNIDFARVTAGTVFSKDSVGGPITIALNTTPVTPQITDFPLNVNITDPSFTTVTDVSATLSILDGSLNDLSAELIGPNGQTITLFQRRGAVTAPFFGISGANLGRTALGTWIGTTFDDNASQNINQGTSPYVGTYTPEFGTMNGPFKGDTPTGGGNPNRALNGLWTLRLTNWSTATSPAPTVIKWTLNLVSGFNQLSQTVVASTPVHGSPTGTYTLGTQLSPTGIGPAPVIASDNTLGSFSPNEGALYVAYVSRDITVNSNPALNTDISLMVSRDGGLTWRPYIDPATGANKVNDDNSQTDGYTGSVDIPGLTVNGRSQFMPAIAVDDATGTVVMSWRDARNDVQDGRVATYLTTSIDGGRTFSPDVYANPSLTATDRITGNTVNYGPSPDNQTGGLATDSIGYGLDMGLAAYAGKIIPVWSSNFDGNAGIMVPKTANLGIVARLMETASGPRVINGTMGPVGLPGDTVNAGTGPDGTPKPNHIRIDFDREVDPTTFTPSDVEVFFKGTTSTSTLVPLFVAAVTPISGDTFGATSFQVTFDPTKNADGTTRTGNLDFTGTYSYLIKPGISDRIRSLVNAPVNQPTIVKASGPINMPFAAADGSDSAQLTVSGFPNSQLITGITVNLSITEQRDGNLTIVLVGPNGASTLYQSPTDNGVNFTNTTFSDAAGQSIFGGSAPYTGSFKPTTPLNVLTGSSVNGTYTLEIFDNGAGDTGILKNWSITINSTAAATGQVSLGNTMDQNADSTSGQDITVTPFTGLTPGDEFMAPMPAPVVPLVFDLRPGSGNLFPSPPYDQKTLPLIVSGPRLASVSVPSPGYQPGSPDALVLNNTVSSLDVHFDRDMNPNTVNAASVLQIMGPAGPITGPQTYRLSAASQGQVIPSGTGVPLNSTITIPSDAGTFPISHLAVSLDMSVVQDSAITVFLIAPDGSKIQLFSGLQGSNFTKTVLDDSAATSISSALAPYTGVFKPANSLQTFIAPNGVPMDLAPTKNKNTWTLQVLNSKKGNVGTLNSWSLIATPQISVTPDPLHTGDQRTYRVNFPQQQLSGTYTVQMASTITSAAGDAMDSNLNAGVEFLNGGGTDVATTPVSYSAAGLPLTVPTASFSGPGQLQSTINVPDNFLVQGITAAGLAGLTVKLNLSGSIDPDFEATLVYHLGQSDQVTVPLFNFDGLSPVGNVGTNQGAGFQNTVFTDLSPTPIQTGGPPFFATTGFRSQNPLLSSSSYTDAQGVKHTTPGFKNLNVNGTWTLVVKNTNNGGAVAKLNSWSMTFQKPLPNSGLGEPVADQVSTSFRIFTMDPTNPLSSNEWTAVGPGAIDGGTGNNPRGSSSGRIGGLAVDTSDPSGNTVFTAGASGGVWKTTNFLSPNGPTWIPLTDFGPTFSMNMGSIAVFPRNNDPRQSIVIAATGEGDTGSTGVGFLISKDGGATWNLYDSTNNVSSINLNNINSNDNLLPISSTLRDHAFVGDSAFKVMVDPKLTPTGQVIIYAALSGPTGGIWRSENTGQTWQLMRSGQATDVTADPLSGTGAPGGNLQIIYGAFRGDGVYISPNQGQVWNLMAGTGGNPLLVNPLTQKNVNPATTPSPNGGLGRIQLATLIPTGNRVHDDIYQEWLYAVVSTPDSHLSAVYVTKDFGANWTSVRIPTLPPVTQNGLSVTVAVPTNDVNQSNYDIGGGKPGSGFPAQLNYDMTLAIDPTNPAVIYLGGTADNQSTGFLRIDTTNIWDAHNATPYDNNGILGGTPRTTASVGPMSLSDTTKNLVSFDAADNVTGGETNVIGYSDAYIGNQLIFDGGGFTNNGAGVKWIPFDIGGTDQHEIITEVDPATGLPRLIIGDDQGLFTAIDNKGTFFPGVGNAVSPTGSVNGNLQITQFYYGTAQPSNAASQVAQALLFSSAQDDGAPFSDQNILQTGQIVWHQSFVIDPTGGGAGIGDAAGVGTDQTGSGTSYLYAWPCCGGLDTAFFQDTALTGSLPSGLLGQTDGLLQQSNGLPTPDPQWPSTFGANFAVNPLNGNQVAMSSSVGRIFRTETAEQTTVNWFEIGNPAALDNSYAPAIAFGAPDPQSPAGIGNLDNFMYIGTSAGHIFMSQVGGGANGNSWTNISNGLDGSTIQQIITDPVRGSHDAYAVTSAGVYFVPDSVALANAVAAAAQPNGPPVPAALTWQNITGNLFTLMHNSFNNPDFAQQLPHFLTSVQADWRYAIPNNPLQPAGPNTPSHPVLYVGSGAGVYRSFDFGQTWAIYPNMSTDNSLVDGGYLPDNQVSSLAMSIGNVDVNTGRAVQAPGDPNVLVAATYGRGDFVIRLAPAVFQSSVQLSKTSPLPAGSFGGLDANGLPIVTVSQPVFNGVSEQTAFGNTVRISLYDMTDPNNPVFVGGYDGTTATDTAANHTDAYGNFSVQLNPNAYTSKGVKTIGIQATDAAGTKGGMTLFTFDYQNTGGGAVQPPTPPTLALAATSDSSHGLSITNDNTPQLVGVTDPNVTVTLVDINGNAIPGVTPVTSDPVTGAFTLQYSSGLVDGKYTVKAKATNSNGSSFSTTVTFTIKTTGPATNVFQGLASASDTGIKGDNVTVNRQPLFVGTTAPNASGDPNNVTEVELLQVTSSGTTLLATLPAAADGSYSVQLPASLNDGKITLETRVRDVAGNFGPTSSQVTVQIVSGLADYNLDSKTDPALFRRTSIAQGTWLIQGVTPNAGLSFGGGGVVPFTGDFNLDGVSDLAYYNLSTSTWFIENSQGTNLQPGSPPNPPTQIPLGSAGAIPVAGDFGGTGGSEVGVYMPGKNGAQSTWLIQDNAQGLVSYTFGLAGDIPMPGDYDAVGHAQIAVYRPSTGAILVLQDAATNKVETLNTGVLNGVPVSGQFDNIGYFNSGKASRTEPAVFNPTTGLMTIVGPTGNYTVQFQKGDIPASGDYDGIGETEPAVYRPSAGAFVIFNPVAKKFETVAYGTASDIPVLAPYSYRQALLQATVTPTISLLKSDDSSNGLNITNVTKPHFTGTADPNAQIDLINVANGNVLATVSADASGNYSIAPTASLPDGTYTFQTRAYGFGTDAGLKSTKVTLTIQTSLQVVSVSPTKGTYNSLPNGKIVVTLSHPITGVKADDPTGAGFSSHPFAVTLVPRGPSGTFSAPSGLDSGSTAINATLVYHVNADGTATITLFPQAPLGTDMYRITVSGALRDLAGNPLLNGSAQPGAYTSTFTIKAGAPNGTALKVASVTTQHASVSIHNNTIPQPDTIAIGFNKALNFLTVNTTTVQLLGPSNTVIQAGVAYSPTTKTIYLTPEAKLSPGITYTIKVAGSVSDDQAFPNPDLAFSLGKAFTTTFKVNSEGAGAGTSPLQVVKQNGHLAVSPGPGTRTTPFGYASIPFTEPLDMTSLGRFAVKLTLQAGGINQNGFDAADAPINAKLAFNPNTNTLIVVPTVTLGSGTYLYTIGHMKAKNGDSLGGTPLYTKFTVQLPGAKTVSHHSQTAAEHVIASIATSSSSPVAVTPSISTNQVTSNTVSFPRNRHRPVQHTTPHDHILGRGFNVRNFFSTRRGQAIAAHLDRIAADRANGD